MAGLQEMGFYKSFFYLESTLVRNKNSSQDVWYLPDWTYSIAEMGFNSPSLVAVEKFFPKSVVCH